MSIKQALLSSYQMGDLLLKNRVIMAPLTRCRADNPEIAPTDLHALYYKQRAGAGLLITEASPVAPMGIGYLHTPGMYNEAQLKGWEKVCKAVHSSEGRIFAQLWHVGRMSHPDFLDGKLPWSSSAISPGGQVSTPLGRKDKVVPHAVTIEEIQLVKKQFIKATINALNVGFDGVEIHSSNGYLFHQFFCLCSNERTDKYGGSKENRTRIIFELLDELKEHVPLNRIGLRFNPSMHGMSGFTIGEDTLPTFDFLIEKLNNYDLAYVHLSEPFNDVSEVPFADPKVTHRYRKIYKGTLMTNTRFDQKRGNEYLENNIADLIAYGVPYIGNPDLAERFAANVPLAESDKSTFYSPGPKGYTDYPNFDGTIGTL